MDYVIIVNDNGELKTISATELAPHMYGAAESHNLEVALNRVLDERWQAEDRKQDAKRNASATMAQRVADDTEHANRGQR